MKRFIIFLVLVASVYSPLNGEEYQFKGKHFMASYLGCDEEAMKNIEALKEAFAAAARASHATILRTLAHKFDPSGLTMILLLSESHASIHTYPEHHACFVDLFTCGDKCSSSEFDAVLRAYLKPVDVKCCELLRSDQIETLSLMQ